MVGSKADQRVEKVRGESVVRGHVAARQTTPKAFGAKSVLIHAPFKRLVLVKKIFCAVVVGFNSDFRFRR
jgi:hypothetical protein